MLYNATMSTGESLLCPRIRVNRGMWTQPKGGKQTHNRQSDGPIVPMKGI